MAHAKEILQIGDVSLTLDEAEETLNAIRGGRVDAVVVDGIGGEEVFTFRDPSHPFRLLVEAMNEGAMLTSADGIISYQNPWLSRLVGIPGEQMQGRSLLELVTPETRTAAETLLRQAGEGTPARGNVDLVAANGAPLPVLLSVSCACLADVEVLCVVVTDLTEQQRQETLYGMARVQIEERDRLFAVASHELRNPLNVLDLQARLLGALIEASEDGAPLPTDRALGMVSKLRIQARRLGQLVTNLLDVGSIGAGRLALDLEDVDLSELVRSAMDLCRDEIDRSRSRVSLELTPVRGRWDRVRIEQIIDNLVSNAAKYGGGLPIRVFVEQHGDTARLGVEDQGRGIPQEARERIFRPFERVSQGAPVPGLGIGLYVTSQIVKSHGGRISVQPGTQGGSLFLVELPIAGPG